MMKRLIATLALLVAGTGLASAQPSAPPAEARIILAAGGCGFGFHPNFEGLCVPNRRAFYGPGPYGPGPVVLAPGRIPPPCPRGYYRDPDPARRLCYPYR